ncbi:glycoside hydrolase family 15 protein [Yinghuangia aomiensis]|uniref:Glycoside hydrolase family 15 protein n=1 Tax=Yinghuangia aomiensis TaxID=676205 RepID=A0ABP9I8G5_9ACTN
MRRYPPIANHGIVGDLQTCALVSDEGVIDWFCAPRFDSGSVFAALLDADNGGRFAVTSTHHETTVRQLYLSDSAVLVTRFLTPDGIGEVADFMPLPDDPAKADDRHRIMRVLRVVRGSFTFAIECSPRFDFGRKRHQLQADGPLAHFAAEGIDLYVQTLGDIDLAADGDDLRAHVELHAGQVSAIVLTADTSGDPAPAPLDRGDVRDALSETRHFWNGWVRSSHYRGRWHQMVNRSAITLKLLTYAPTGAPIAAATMGLPEEVGGERNWDYRYTWIRDASLTMAALGDLGFTDEVVAFGRWVGARVRERRTVTGEPLQIMYRVDGDPELGEEVVEGFSGYQDSPPVRAGNGAADQLQLDIYGEAVFALFQAPVLADVAGYDGWQALSSLLDWLAESWDRPDEGIWETRGGRQNFTYSRIMCWTAFDRGIRLAREFARPANIVGWVGARDAIFRQVMEQGWSDERGAFVQQYGTNVLDASLLLMPVVGFISAHDPRWLSTLDAMDTELVSDSLVYRYNPAASPDGLRGAEGTFSLCSFLYVAALAKAGRVDQARYAFDKMLTYANHVGLFAEEIGASGEQLGNFPQAFTHLALIMAARALDEALDAEEAAGH